MGDVEVTIKVRTKTPKGTTKKPKVSKSKKVTKANIITRKEMKGKRKQKSKSAAVRNIHTDDDDISDYQYPDQSGISEEYCEHWTFSDQPSGAPQPSDMDE